jgi:hypothetical protein
MSGIKDRIEQKRNQLSKMVCMKVCEKDVLDLMTVDAGLKKVGKRSRAEIYDESNIRFNIKTGGCPRRMEVCPGTQDG